MAPDGVAPRIPPLPSPHLLYLPAQGTNAPTGTVYLGDGDEAIAVRRAGEPEVAPNPGFPRQRHVTRLEAHRPDRAVVTMLQQWPAPRQPRARPTAAHYYTFAADGKTNSQIAVDAKGKVLYGWWRTVSEHPRSEASARDQDVTKDQSDTPTT